MRLGLPVRNRCSGVKTSSRNEAEAEHDQSFVVARRSRGGRRRSRSRACAEQRTRSPAHPGRRTRSRRRRWSRAGCRTGRRRARHRARTATPWRFERLRDLETGLEAHRPASSRRSSRRRTEAPQHDNGARGQRIPIVEETGPVGTLRQLTGGATTGGRGRAPAFPGVEAAIRRCLPLTAVRLSTTQGGNLAMASAVYAGARERSINDLVLDQLLGSARRRSRGGP